VRNLKTYGHGRAARLRAKQVFLLVLAALLCGPAIAVAEQSASEHAVKAAIVYKIAKFVSWPEDALADDGDLPICLPAEDPIGPAMEALAGKQVQGRTIRIHRFKSTAGLSEKCAVLFLSQAGALPRPSLVSGVANAPVLTIGDSKDFVDIGGIVTLEVQKNRVQFAINVGASDRAGLGISAQLLQLAKIRN